MKKVSEKSHIILTTLLYITFILVFIFAKHPEIVHYQAPKDVYINLEGIVLSTLMFDFAGLIVFFKEILPHSKKTYNCLVILFIIFNVLILFNPLIGFGLNIVTLSIGLFLILPRFVNKKK